MTPEEVLELDERDPAALRAHVEDALGGRSLEDYAHQCHAASQALVNSTLFDGPVRVARGWAPVVGVNHSWVAMGLTPWGEGEVILDVTQWSYEERAEPEVRVFRYHRPDGLTLVGHAPQGGYSVWATGRPESGGAPVKVEVDDPEAQRFLALLGPLSVRGWGQLMHGGMLDWPSGPVVRAVLEVEALAPHVPVDVAANAADHDPEGIYLPFDWPERLRGER